MYGPDPTDPTGATLMWEPIGTAPSAVTISENERRNAADAPPANPQVGDVFINRADDDLAWVYGPEPSDPTGVARVWEPIGTAAATVTVSTTAGETPQANPPANAEINDLFVNRADGGLDLGVRRRTERPDRPHPTIWEPVAPDASTVTITDVAGQTPAANPPVDPNDGDAFVNRADGGLTWLYGEDPANAGQFIWTPVGVPDRDRHHQHDRRRSPDRSRPGEPARQRRVHQPGGRHLVHLRRGPRQRRPVPVGTAPASADDRHRPDHARPRRRPSPILARPLSRAYPVDPLVGDIVVSRPDNESWIFAEDPNTPGDFLWERLSEQPRVTIVDNPGTVPLLANPGAIPPVAAWPVDPMQGDTFVNRADSTAWIFGEEPGAPGQMLWEPIGGAPDPVVTIVLNPGDNPGANPPLEPPNVGDIYVNRSDAAVWVYAENPLAVGHAPSGSR